MRQYYKQRLDRAARQNRRRTATPEQTKVLENVQNPTHLAEDENARTLDFHPRQLVEDNHLSGILDQVFV